MIDVTTKVPMLASIFKSTLLMFIITDKYKKNNVTISQSNVDVTILF